MNWKHILVAVAALLVIIGTEFAYRKPLWKETNELIHRLQDKQSSSILKVWNQFSITGLGTMPGLILLMSIDYRYRANQVYWIFLLTILNLVMNVTKMAYREARPFWVDPTIYLDDCSVEFGNPSGHSMMAALLAVALAFSILELVTGDSKRRVILGLLVFPLAIVYFFAMGWSRLTLGVHSLNQIVYGWLLGIWIAVVCHFCLKDLIVSQANSFLKSLTSPSWKEVLVVIAIQVIGIGAQIGVYYIVDKEFDPPMTWSAMILLLCKEKPEHAYHHESFKAIGYTFGSFGAYWGMYIQQQLFKGQTTINSPSRYVILKYLGRLAVLIVLIVPWAAILLFVKLENVWANMLVKKGIAVFGIAFTITAVYDWLCQLIRLYDRSANPLKLLKI